MGACAQFMDAMRICSARYQPAAPVPVNHEPLCALRPTINQLNGGTALSQAELRTENGFLRDQVRRLTDELARAQSTLGHSHSTADGAAASQGGRSFLEVRARDRGKSLLQRETEGMCADDVCVAVAAAQALPDGAPLPAWLSDSQYLSPLLLAYDQRIAEQVRWHTSRHELSVSFASLALSAGMRDACLAAFARGHRRHRPLLCVWRTHVSECSCSCLTTAGEVPG